MKLYQCVALMVLVFAVIFQCTANENVQNAAKGALLDVSGGRLGKLYKVRNQADTPKQREMISKACVVGLYAIGDNRNAAKIKKDLVDVRFVSSLMRKCDSCQGKGTSSRKCFKCQGAGKCQNSRCNDGVIIAPGFDGRRSARKCSACGGTGKCKNCDGTGLVLTSCVSCHGEKRIVNKDSAMEMCKDVLKMLVSSEQHPEKEVDTTGDDNENRKTNAANDAVATLAPTPYNHSDEKIPNAPKAPNRQLSSDSKPHYLEEFVTVKNRQNVTEEIDGNKWKFDLKDGKATITEVSASGDVTIPNKLGGCTVVAIKKDLMSFCYCTNLTSITIPSCLTSIESGAFYGCDSLLSICVENGNKEYCSIDGMLYSARVDRLLQCPSGKSGFITIPASVTTIDDVALSACHLIKSIKVECDNQFFTAVDGILYSKNMDRLILCPDVTEGCVTIPAGVKIIGKNAFAAGHLTSVSFPESLTTIEDGAFGGCRVLTSLTIPAEVVTIGECAFCWCSSLDSVTMTLNVRTIGKRAFIGCNKLKNILIPGARKHRAELEILFENSWFNVEYIKDPDDVAISL